MILVDDGRLRTGLVIKESDDEVLLLPNLLKPDKIETITRKSPCGTVETHVAQYEREGALIAINGTTLAIGASDGSFNGNHTGIVRIIDIADRANHLKHQSPASFR